MFAAIWARGAKWLIALATALLALAAFYLKGRAAGKAVEQKKATQRDLTEAKAHAETIRETSDVEAKIIRLPDSAVRQRLRDKWQRD
jgi:alkylation response protein AidB-like acyl-CoA dehydrogenase